MKECLVKIFLTLSGPIFTYGLYYFDIFSDFSLMITLFTNCHKYYGIMSLSIICVSYATTAVFVKFKFNIEKCVGGFVPFHTASHGLQKTPYCCHFQFAYVPNIV